MGRYEDDAKNDVAELCFKHSFSEVELHDFAQEYGYPTTLRLMEQCIDVNMAKQKKNVPIVSFIMLFRRASNKYKNGHKKELIAEEKRAGIAANITQWREERDKALENGFTATDDEICSGLVKFKDEGYIDEEHYLVRPSDEDYQRGLKFLKEMKVWHSVKEKHLDGATA